MAKKKDTIEKSQPPSRSVVPASRDKSTEKKPRKDSNDWDHKPADTAFGTEIDPYA